MTISDFSSRKARQPHIRMCEDAEGENCSVRWKHIVSRLLVTDELSIMFTFEYNDLEWEQKISSRLIHRNEGHHWVIPVISMGMFGVHMNAWIRKTSTCVSQLSMISVLTLCECAFSKYMICRTHYYSSTFYNRVLAISDQNSMSEYWIWIHLIHISSRKK